MPRQITTLTRLVLPAILLAALFPARSLGAETRVTGEPDAVRVEARDSRVEEVLVALGASFGLQYRSTSALSRRVSGTYEGSLRRVVTRLLDGYDFVMKTGSDGIEVTVYGSATPGAAGPTPTAAQPAASAANTSPTQTPAQARREARRKHSD